MREIVKPMMYGAAAVTMSALASSTVLAEETETPQICEETTTNETSALADYNEAQEDYNTAVENQQLYNDVENKIDENEALIDRNEARLDEVQETYESVDNEIQNLEEQLEIAKSDTKEAQTDYETILHDHKDVTEQSLSDAQEIYDNAQNQEAEVQKNYDALDHNLITAQSELNKTEELILSTDETLEKLQHENEKLIDHNETLNHQMNEKTEELKSLESNEDVSSEYQALLDKVKENQQTVTDLKNQKDLLEKELSSTEEEKSDLTIENEKKKKELEMEENLHSQTEEKLNQFTNAVTEKKNQLEAAENLNTALQKEADAINKALENAYNTEKEKKNLLDDAVKELELSKKAANDMKTMAENAQTQIDKGSKGFFEAIGANAAADMLSYPDLQQYVHLGKEGDATSLEQMAYAINYINQCNALRAGEGKEPLRISSYLMAIAQISSDAIRDKFLYEDSIGHLELFRVDENIAYAYDPYSLWYTEEKQNYDQGIREMSEIGHYLNIIGENHPITGYGVSEYYFHVQDFDSLRYKTEYGAVQDEAYTCEEYAQLFNAYCSILYNADQNYQNALQRQNQAETEYKNAKQDYDLALSDRKDKEAFLNTIKTQLKAADETYRQQKNKYEKALSEAETMALSYQKEEKKLETLRKEKEVIETSLFDVENNINQLVASIKNLNRDITNATEKYDESVRELESGDPTSLKTQAILNTKKELESLQSQMQENLDTIEANNKKMAELQNVRDTLMATKSDLTEGIKEYQSELDTVTIHLNNAKENANNAKEKLNRIQSVLKAKADAKDRLENAVKMQESLESKRNELTDELSVLEDEITALKEENDRLIGENIELEKQAVQYYERFKDIEEKETKLNLAKERLEQMKNVKPCLQESASGDIYQLIEGVHSSKTVETGIVLDGSLWSCLFSVSGLVFLSLVKKKEEIL